VSFGKDDTVETKQTTDPWAPAQPALKNILGQAGSLFNQGKSELGNRDVSGLYGQATGALSTLFGGTGPLSNLSATAEGDFLNNNPYRSEMFSALSGDVTDAVNSAMSGAGRTGDPVHTAQLTKELGKLGSQIYYDDYSRERQNQLGAGGQLGSFLSQATSQAPGVYDFGNADLDALWKNLARYSTVGQSIGGMGGTQVGTQPDNSPSGLQQGIGAALSLASLFSDRNAKTDIREADEDAVLSAIRDMPMFNYRYKPGGGDGGAEPRLGPMAQDWSRTFGGDGTTIPMPQVIGAMLTAIKALARRVETLEAT